MNILPQMKLFGESGSEEPGDLERLQTVLGTLYDAGLIRKLYRMREKGRNDWPCEVLWNCEEDRRIFTPVARDSYKWRSLYRKRTGIERINRRIDRDAGLSGTRSGGSGSFQNRRK